MYCNNCGKENPENSKYCQFCGIKFTEKTIKHETTTILESKEEFTIPSNHAEQIDSSKHPYPYVISTTKLVLMSLATLGVYQVYWFYKQFKSFKALGQCNVVVWFSALFAGLTSYTLFKGISNAVKEINPDKGFSPRSLAILYFFIGVFLGFFNFIPLIDVQNNITYYWEKKLGDKLVRSPFGVSNFIAIIIVWIVVITFALIPADESGSNSANSLYTDNTPSTDNTAQNKHNWITYNEPSGKFSVLLPSYPTLETDILDDWIPFKSYTSEVGDSLAYYVGVATYDPEVTDNSLPREILDGALTGMLDSDPKNVLINSSDTYHDSYPAKDFLIHQSGITMKGRILLAENVLYEVMVSYYESAGVPSGYNEYISSLTIK